MSSSSPSPVVKNKPSSKLKTTHLDRDVSTFQVQDGELEQISTMNAWQSLFFSLAGISLSAALGLWGGLLLADKSGSSAELTAKILVVLGGALTILFICLGFAARSGRHSLISRIMIASGRTPKPSWNPLSYIWRTK